METVISALFHAWLMAVLVITAMDVIKTVK